MSQIIRTFFRWLAEGWCHLMHPDPLWPVNGRYRCPACYRTYPVPWANAGSSQEDLARRATEDTARIARVFARPFRMNQAH
jgi:hypothetical protein